MALMTNTKLATFRGKSASNCLTEIERQRLTILRIVTTPSSCPMCHNLVDQVAASGKSLDDFDLDNGESDFTCPHCQTRLVEVVPFQPNGVPYLWRRRDPINATYSETCVLQIPSRPPVEYRRRFGRPSILDLENRELKADGTPHSDEWFTVTDLHLRNLQYLDEGREVVNFFARMADPS